MNQKRSWPGVPKRYSTRRLPMVIRPKSIATNVVLPAPNPPAMRILNAASERSGVPSEGAEPMQYLLKQVGAGLFTGASSWHHGNAALLDEVGDEDPDHADRQRHVRRHVSHGGLPPAQAQDPAVLGAEAERIFGRRGRGGGDDNRDQVQHLAVSRLRPAASERVGAHYRASIPINPLVARTHGWLTPPGSEWPGTSPVTPNAARRVSPASPSHRRPGPHRRSRDRARPGNCHDRRR